MLGEPEPPTPNRIVLCSVHAKPFHTGPMFASDRTVLALFGLTRPVVTPIVRQGPVGHGPAVPLRLVCWRSNPYASWRPSNRGK